MYEHRSIAIAGVIAAGLLAGSSVGAMAQTDVAASASPPAPSPTAPSSSASTGEAAVVGPGEEWVAFEAPGNYFDPMADDDGVDGDATIFLMRLDGTGVHRLVPDDFIGSELRPRWSPDGQRMVFVRGLVAGGAAGVWTIDADGENATLVHGCEHPECTAVDYPSWDASGTAVYFSRLSGAVNPDAPPTTAEIWRSDLASGTGEAILTHRAEAGQVGIEQVRVSPDATQAVFVSHRDDDTESALFIANLADGTERRLTEWELVGAHPDWSIHGRIVFNSYDLRIHQEQYDGAHIYTIAPDGTDLRQLTDHEDGTARAAQPSWSPDGEGIIYTLRAPGEEPQIMYMEADGSNQRPLIPGGLAGTHASLRPTGAE